MRWPGACAPLIIKFKDVWHSLALPRANPGLQVAFPQRPQEDLQVYDEQPLRSARQGKSQAHSLTAAQHAAPRKPQHCAKGKPQVQPRPPRSHYFRCRSQPRGDAEAGRIAVAKRRGPADSEQPLGVLNCKEAQTAWGITTVPERRQTSALLLHCTART